MASKEELIEFIDQYVSKVTGDVKFSAKAGGPLPGAVQLRGAINVIISGATTDEVFNALMVVHPTTELDHDGGWKLIQMANIALHEICMSVFESANKNNPERMDPERN